LPAAERAAAQLAERAEAGSARAIRSAFDALDPEALPVLSNPFVRQLACDRPTTTPTGVHLKAALRTLGEAAAVGALADPPSFLQLLSIVAGQTTPPDAERPQSTERIVALAEILRTVRPVHSLLALDLDLYEIVTIALERSAR